MNKAAENQEKVAEIKRQYMFGEITREEAIESINPIIEEINSKAKEIAKKHNMKPRLVNAISLLR